MKLIDTDKIQDPALNLAIEEYALRHLDRKHTYILLYINAPSIIIGRNQNYYEEINHSFVSKHEIPVYRRISGGGAVYHDSGNLNFSIITDYNSKWLNNYEPFNKPIIEALNALKLPAYMDERNAIRIERLKISGNAQFSASGRMFSHGTMLFNSNLSNLKKALDPDMGSIKSRAHKSVRSEIVNICSLLSISMNIEDFKNHLIQYFDNYLGGQSGLTPYDFSSSEWKKIEQIKQNRYDQWSWNVGKSPRFSIQKTIQFNQGIVNVDMEVHKGVIQWVSLGSNFMSGPFLHAVEQKLLSTPFSKKNLRKVLKDVAPLTPIHEFIEQFVDGLFADSKSTAS